MKKVLKIMSIMLALTFCLIVMSSTAAIAVDGAAGNNPDQVQQFTGKLSDTAELPCDGTRHDLATAQHVGQGMGPGRGRAIGFEAERDFSVSSVGIMAGLTNESFEVVIYDSPDGHTPGSVIYTTAATTGGTGYGWNDMTVSFTFEAGNFYVLNWRPADGGSSDWVTSPGMDFYHDNGLPYAVGPITIVEGFEGFDAENASNLFHPHMRLCETTEECDYCLEDSFGYVWCLDVIDQNSEGIYLAGTVDMGYEVRNAVGTYLKKNAGVSLSGDAGSGCPFNYNWKLQGSSGSGVWINISPSAGHGTIQVWMCNGAPDIIDKVEEQRPGIN